MTTVAEIRGVLEDLLADPQIRAAFSRFGPEHEDRMERLESQVGGMLADKSLGLVQSGPLWLSGTSIIDGTVTATKLIVTTLESVTTSTGTLNVTGTITAAAAFPATGERVTISSSGLLGINSSAVTTFKLGVDGSGWLGSGASQVSWTSGGVVSIPAAAIGTLTIADIDSGVFGGTYQTATTGAHINISTTGIVVYNATSEISANETFKLLASTGAVTATGSFTILSAATGAHVKIDNAGGIAGYNATSESTSTRTFLINAATGAGHFGLTTGNHVSWDSAGAVSIHGSLIVTGTIAADRVTSGTFTGGATINVGTADLVVNSTGKLKFGTSSADYLANDILHFEVSADSAKVEFKNGSNTPVGQLRGNASSSTGYVALYAYHSSTHDALVSVQGQSTSSSVFIQALQSSYSTQITVTGSTTRASNNITFATGDVNNLVLDPTNRRALFYGRIYPGPDSGSQNTTRYIYATTINSTVVVAVDNYLYIPTTLLYPVTTTGTSGALPSPTKYIQILNAAGTQAYFIPVFTAVNAWAA